MFLFVLEIYQYVYTAQTLIVSDLWIFFKVQMLNGRKLAAILFYAVGVETH